MSTVSQLLLPFGQTLQMPITPRALGRLAARRGHGPNDNPFDDESFDWIEWRSGWGLIHGIPDSVEGRSDYLQDNWLRLFDALAEIRDDANVPAGVREKARRVLARKDELREG